ncbi:MAG TPA: hypothetical protein DHV48_00380 [Prolixibacteraceae bacterium]|nr:hypothetical protein [Prolixibacteraceae bacterium]
MKNQIEAKSQNSERVYRALGRQNRTTKSINHIFATPAIAPLVVGRGKGIIQGKAPPGSSGAARGHPPALSSDKPAAPPLSFKRGVGGELILQFQFQTFNKYQYSNFYKHFNSIIMKKQILFLVVALFAVTAAFGQINPTAEVSLPPTCGGTATYPSVGVSYPYTVSITATPGYTGVGTYTWKVTDKTDLFATPGSIAADYTGSGTGATYNIVWNASSVGNTYYVVVDYSEANTTGGSCTINNVKVFQVQPMNNFWLKINASTDGTVTGIIANNGTDKINVCSPDVSAANITTTGDPTTARVTYEFGVTELKASIHAAGYTGDFQAILTIAGLTSNQTVAVPSGWAATSVDAMGNGTYSQTLAAVASGSDYALELDITNHQYEGKADLPVRITIDGTYASGTQKDKYDGATDCIDQPDDADYVIHTIKARPTVAPTNPASFVTPSSIF